MKYIGVAVAVALSMLAGACNRHHEPPIETVLPINESYMPATTIFDRSDTEFIDRCREWNDKKIAVNSPDELPDDPLGFSDAYTGINFANQTLLLTYRLHLFDIDSYRVRYVRNNLENIYEWTIAIGSANYDYDDNDDWQTGKFTRFAILVPKMPDGSEWRVWWSYRDFNWDWDD